MSSESDSQLIDGHVSLLQSRKAITALLQHIRKERRCLDETELLPVKEQYVWLVLTVKRVQPMKNLKPQKIPLAHPLVDPRTSAVCLITKDPQREYKDLLEFHKIKFISRVVGIQKLRGKFRGFDARRLLLRENDLFLADERVLPLLPGLLGKKWFEAKKQPIPVSLTKKDLKAELEKAVSSTYMHQNRGTCTSIKFATVSQTDDHVLANLVTALPAVISRIHGGWDNVQSFNIKTSSSVSLPIWSCPLGSQQKGSRWEGMAVDEGEWDGFGARSGGDSEGQSAKSSVLEPAKVTPEGHGKKRAAEMEDQQDSMKKVKKVKPNASTTSTEPCPAQSTVKLVKVSETKPTKSIPKPSEGKQLQFIGLSKPQSIEKANPVKPSKKESKLSSQVSKPKSKQRQVNVEVDRTITLSPTACKSLEELPKRPLKKLRRNDMVATTDSSPISSSSAKSITKKQSPDKSLAPAELTKKVMLGDAQLSKKKSKLRNTDKSVRKGVKAQLIGRAKA